LGIVREHALPAYTPELGTRSEGQPAEVASDAEAHPRRAHAASFTEVFQAHAAYVLLLLRRLGVDDADADDVAQEVFLVVHTQLPAFEGRSTLKTWLTGICLRKASDYRRKAYRRRERITDRSPEPAVAPDQEESLERDRRAAALLHALGQLTHKQREVFVLYEIEELSMAEVASAIGCPRFTAYTRLHGARRALRMLLGQTLQHRRSA
jgi:RNA polymerase sigma-70 factor (ECF subfamily)